MKKTYTKKQITEAIAYWKKQLKKMDESSDNDVVVPGKYLYITKDNPSFKGNVRKVGASGIKKIEDPYQFEALSMKLARYSTCVPVAWEPAYKLLLTPASDADIKTLEQLLFAAIENNGGTRYGKTELFDVDDETLKAIINNFMDEHMLRLEGV